MLSADALRHELRQLRVSALDEHVLCEEIGQADVRCEDGEHEKDTRKLMV